MKFPYGLADFEKIIRSGYFYQDRSDCIPLLEARGDQLLFIRPRRFGKSLLLSMLEHYYDVNRAGQFDALFGHLAVGQNPTPLHNSYYVMRWDFSVVPSHGAVRDIEAALHRHVNLCIKICASDYGLAVDIRDGDAIYSFGDLIRAVRQAGHKLYLLIDEYDNFANEVMMARQGHYEALLYGEGLLKTVFKAVKAAAAGQGLDRVFITGVSPVVLSDMTSGYNVAKNIYLEPEFNDYQALDLLLEFKYLGLKDLNLSGEQLRDRSMAELAGLPAVAAKLAEAETQARRYGDALVQRHGLERLRRYAVVALGFERVVWREIS